MNQTPKEYTGTSLVQLEEAFRQACLAQNLLQMQAIQWYRGVNSADAIGHVIEALWHTLMAHFGYKRETLVALGEDAQTFAAMIAMGLIPPAKRNQMLGLPEDARLSQREESEWLRNCPDGGDE